MKPIGYGASCNRCGVVEAGPVSHDKAATAAAIHRSAHGFGGTVQTLAVCPNCSQWRHGGDCLNRCAERGLAPVASPETLNL
jgi:hypothetical protein